MGEKEKLLRPESDLDTRPSNGWVWQGDDADEHDDGHTQRKPAEVWARHDAALSAAPETALFGNVEIDSVSDPITLTIFNHAQTPVELDSPIVRAGTSNDGHVPVDEFVAAKPSSASVASGRPATLAVAFAPKQVAASRSTLHVRGRAGTQSVDLQVSLRGQGVKQRRDDDPSKSIHAEQREERRASWQSRGVADKHEAAATHTYGEMLTTVLAAQRLTQSGSKDDYAHARELLLSVSRRLHELGPAARERLRDFGWGHNPGVGVYDHSVGAIDDWIQKLALGASIETGHLVTAFEAAADEIRFVTGERADVPTLRELHEASKLTPPAIVGAALGGAALGLLGLALIEAPALVSAVGEEAGLLSLAARSGGQRFLLWGAAHPILAVELVSSFVGVGTAINSWDDFVQALQDPREAMFLLMQVAMELMHLHQARGPRARAGGGDDHARATGSDESQANAATEIRRLSARVRAIAAEATERENERATGPDVVPDHHDSSDHPGSPPAKDSLAIAKQEHGLALDRLSNVQDGEFVVDPAQQPRPASSSIHSLTEQQREAFKRIVDNYDGHVARAQELRADPHVAPLIAQLTDDELIALLGYTHNDYRKLNAALRTNDNTSLKLFDIYINLAENALRKLPNYTGPVFRGTDLTTAQLDTYTVGAVMVEPAFTSTSYDPKAKFSGNVVFEIRSRTGKQIDFLSYFAYEREVLMAPRTMLRVLTKMPDPSGAHQWRIVCEEMP